jgi:hypothetical protein
MSFFSRPIACFVLSACFFASASCAAETQPIKLGDLPLLFVDDSGVATSSGLSRTVHVAQTHDKPVIESPMVTDMQRVYVYGSVIEEEGVYIFWYNTRAQAKGGDYVLYATSKDGLAWTKPAMKLYEFPGWPENNIVFEMHSPSVLVDRFEKEPSRRYKMLGYDKRKKTGYQAATSADGIHWKECEKNPIIPGGDTITFAQDPRSGEYLAYHKHSAKIGDVGRRTVWLSRSKDFETWSKPDLVFAPDAEDDSWAKLPETRTEVYNMSVYPHAAGFIGLPTMFRLMRTHKQVGEGQSQHDGPIDVQLVTSSDGTNWRRSWPRVNVIPRGEPGTFDAGAFLGVSSTAVHTPDETWVYYTALTTGHGGPIPEKKLSIGRAAWRRHGFVSLDADPVGGRVETVPLAIAGKSLIVNADARRGELRVGLLRADGSPLAGHALADCRPLKQDATQWKAQWDGTSDLSSLGPVRVVIEMKSARLYSIASEEM